MDLVILRQRCCKDLKRGGGMKKAIGKISAALFACALFWIATSHAQLPNLGRGGQDWSTSSADAQRTSWIKTDYAISPESMAKPGFKFLWKLKLNNQPNGLNSLSQPVMNGQVGGYRGFKSLAYVGGSSNTVFSIDYDLATVEWTKHLEAPAEKTSTPACRAGMTASITRSVSLTPAAARGFGGAFPGRGVAFSSAVGEPNQGAPDIFHTGNQPVQFGGGAARGRGPGGNDAAARGRGRGPAFGGFGGGSGIYAVTSDGALHTLGVSSGKEIEKPVQFLPAASKASALVVVDDVAYTATSAPCGGAPNALWALDIATPTEANAAPAQPVSWKTNGGPVVGDSGPALGEDGTLYVAIGSGSGAGYSNAVVALAPKTLTLKDSFSQANADFSSSPVVFKYKDKNFVAAAAKDGRIFVLDASSLGGADHKTPVAVSQAYSNAKSNFAPLSLASWADTDGTRWILEAFEGTALSGVSGNGNGSVTHGGIIALKVTGEGGSISLTPAWVSRDMNSPLTPMIVNGVAFAVASGKYDAPNASATERVKRSAPAVLYALDANTGKELWNSGQTMKSFASGGLSESPGQVYVTTYDGTFYTFGMPAEREQD